MKTSRQLPLIAPPEPAPNAATGTVRLMLFNAQHAAPGRARRQAAWIAAQKNADLVVITEVGAGPGGQALIEALDEHGYSHVLASEPAAPDYRAVLGSRGPALTPLPSSLGPGRYGLGLGSPAVPVWLIAPCSRDGLGGVAPGTVGA